MNGQKGKDKVCSRGHQFTKSSDCPVCPLCWSGYYKKKYQSDFPPGISAPALRALLNNDVMNLEKLTLHTKDEVASWHGIGPNAMTKLQTALHEKQLSFKQP